MNVYQRGFNLIKLAITLSVSTISLTIGVPALTDFYTRYRANSSIRVIQQTLQLARNQAISLNRKVTACALIDNKCTPNWQVGLTVFIDIDGNNELNNDDKILYTTNAFNSHDTVKYNRSAVRFQPDGLTSGTNGTVKYCPLSATNPYSRAVIVNQAGRVRFSTKNNITCI